jgi:hypothetical protein
MGLTHKELPALIVSNHADACSFKLELGSPLYVLGTPSV